MQPTLVSADGPLRSKTLRGHDRDIFAVAVTPDGQRQVSGSYDKTLKVWNLASGREEKTLRGHSDAVDNVAITPDGRRPGECVSVTIAEDLGVGNGLRGRSASGTAGLVLMTLRSHRTAGLVSTWKTVQ